MIKKQSRKIYVSRTLRFYDQSVRGEKKKQKSMKLKAVKNLTLCNCFLAVAPPNECDCIEQRVVITAVHYACIEHRCVVVTGLRDQSRRNTSFMLSAHVEQK